MARERLETETRLQKLEQDHQTLESRTSDSDYEEPPEDSCTEPLDLTFGVKQDLATKTLAPAKLCYAIYNYDATDDEELSFKKGEEIQILENFWDGRLLARSSTSRSQGIIPSNYVEERSGSAEVSLLCLLINCH